MTTIPVSVSSEMILKQVRRRMRSMLNPTTRKHMKLVSRAVKDWGDFQVYEEKELRDLVGDSIAHRLGLNPAFVKERLDQLNRIARYVDQSANHPGVEG